MPKYIPQNTLYWLAATRLPNIGPIIFQEWLKLFGNIEKLFTAKKSELAEAGLTPKQIYHIHNPDWRAAEKDLIWCEKHACDVLTLDDSAYPKLLREIPDPPLVLYARGDITLLNQPQLAIVGSRNPTPAGRELANQFAQALAKSGLYITSGLALGIDAASHRGTLEAGGKTLAVFGTGLSYIYPRAHQKLAEEIIERGVILSEFSPYEPPKATHFPRRNRIISGLSLGVLVVEAALRSGSLITARYATEQGREVFAIPGSIHNPLAHGCHYLIRQGAKLVETAADVIEELGALQAIISPINSTPQPKNHDTLAPTIRALLAQIGYEATPLDAIIMRSGLTTAEVSSMLLSLELQGLVQAVRGGYQRK